VGGEGKIKDVTRDNGRAVDTIAHVDLAVERLHFTAVLLHGDVWIGRVPEDRDVAILIADIDFAVDDKWRAPRSSEHIVDPMPLSSLRIEAMEQSTIVGDVKDIVPDCRTAQRAVHDFVEVDLSIVIFIDGAEMPNRG